MPDSTREPGSSEIGELEESVNNVEIEAQVGNESSPTKTISRIFSIATKTLRQVRQDLQKMKDAAWIKATDIVIPKWLKGHINFYRLHLAYIILVALLGTLIISITPKGALGHISFVDAFFNATSAVTVTGLVSVRMATFSIFDEVVLVALMLAGSQVFTSLLPVLVRRYYFHLYLKDHEGSKGPETDSVNSGEYSANDGNTLNTIREQQPSAGQHLTSGRRVEHIIGTRSADSTQRGVLRSRSRAPSIRLDTDVNHPDSSLTWSAGDRLKEIAQLKLAIIRLSSTTSRSPVTQNNITDQTGHDGESFKILDGTSSYVDTRARHILEYRSLQVLSWLVPAYFVGIQVVAIFLIRLTFLGAPHERHYLKSQDVSQWFFSVFSVVSAFNNAGFALVDDNLISFHRNIGLLIILAILILAGNTMYPPTMRCIVVLLHKFGPSSQRDAYKFLLEHPRRCFTHLFPWDQTLWLITTVVVLNFIELVFFCALDWNSSALKGLSGGYKMLDGLFQSINTRSSGLVVFFISLLSPPMLLLWCGMMYLSVYPVYLSRQRTRQEKELYADHDVGVFEEFEPLDNKFLTQTRKIIARDSAYLFLGILFICIIEHKKINRDPNFQMFSIIFEVISAYGNVGLSLGYTCVPPEGGSCESPPYSFAGVWSVPSKLMLIVIMILGRHRGLPDNIDSAIVIPEKESFRIGLRRTLSGPTLQPHEPFLSYRDQSPSHPHISRTQSESEPSGKQAGEHSKLDSNKSDLDSTSRV